MIIPRQEISEESLDPKSWPEFRALAHRMVDDVLTHMETVRERPVWQPMPDDVKAHFNQALPTDPAGAEAAYEAFLSDVLPYPMGNTHPRFWAWVMGNGTPLGVMADMLASSFNPNMGGGSHAGNLVEAQIIEWCKELLGYAPEASGLLVSGGSMANLVGLTVARNVKAGFDVRAKGVQATERQLVMYTSSEAHSSVQRAVEVLGLGSESLRKIPVNAQFGIDIKALESSIAADRVAGLQPICIIGNLGTTNTGAIDDLTCLADICEREGLWFHVDGAFGASVAFSPELRHLADGMERADSIAFDLHKWMYLPFEVGVALVRSAKDHRDTFTLTPDYLAHGTRGMSGGTLWFSDYGVQLTRGMRALKVWMSLKAEGSAKFGRLIVQNIEQTRYLREQIKATPELEVLATGPLQIICFRYRVPGMPDMDEAALNAFNEEVVMRLQESGIAGLTGTKIHGSYAIRACITNHRTRFEDVDVVVEAIRKIGAEIAKSG